MTEGKPIRVAIAADRAIVRRGLAAQVIAAKNFDLVGEAEDGVELIQLCELVVPDLILLDLHVPLENCQGLVQVIHHHAPDTRVALFVSMKDDGSLRCDLEGNIYFLSKDISEEDLLNYILQICQDLPPRVQRGLGGPVNTRQLEGLAEELRTENLDPITLGALLNQRLPAIFLESQINIRIFPAQDLVAYPIKGNNSITDAAFRWLRTISTTHHFRPGAVLPWGEQQPGDSTLFVAPILRGRQPIGGITLAAPKKFEKPDDFLPAIQTLAEHIAAVLAQAQSQPRLQEDEVLARELTMAGKIQSDILPEKAPTIPGWEVAARLESARETSGDFYDFIPLSEKNWGFVIADVTDKGMGAALFMALTSTLFRTFAGRYPTLPALTMDAVNDRILSDTRGNMFVTGFLGVLETHTGRMRFVNAGHPPAILINGQRSRSLERLRPTGMALGVMENMHWQQKMVKIFPGDTLVLYTDGITEAQDPHGGFFGEQRLLDFLRTLSGAPAWEITEALIQEVHAFIGESPRQDDIAIIVIRRKG